MSTQQPIAPIQSPITDSNGNITLAWAAYFTQTGQINTGNSGSTVTPTFTDPVPTGISIVDNPDGVTRDITLSWTYTAGTIAATGFFVGYIAGTTGTITRENATYISLMAQGDVTNYSYLFAGVPVSNEYRAGIAAYYVADGVNVLGNIIQPISAPDWRVAAGTANNTGNITFTGANIDPTYGFNSAVTVNQSNSGNGITATVTTAYNAIMGRALGNGNGVNGTATGSGYGVESQNPSNYALDVNGKMSISNNTMVANLCSQYLGGLTSAQFVQYSSIGTMNVNGLTIGAQTATFNTANKPGGAPTTNVWMQLTLNGTLYYIPIWQ